MLIYSFRSYKELPQLKDSHPNLFVFGKLKQDFPVFCDRLAAERPEWIIGVANPISSSSQIEVETINCFNRSKKILSGEPEAYPLFIPASQLKIATQPSDSFCNWTMYRISHYLKTKAVSSKLVFTHANFVDFQTLRESLIRSKPE